MTSNRVGGATPGDPSKGPDTRTQEQHRKIEKIEKVRAVDETENEQTRKKFQKFMDEQESPKKEPHAPGPLETDFYKVGKEIKKSLLGGSEDSSSAVSDLGEHAVASPSYSPPPNCKLSPEPKENETPPLPRSRKFWEDLDSPPDQKTEPLLFKESHLAKTPPHAKTSRKEESFYSPPEKSVENHPKSGIEKGKSLRDRDKNEPVPLQAEITPMQRREKKQSEESELFDSTKKAKRKATLPLPSERETQFSHERPFEPYKEEDSNSKKSIPIEIESPSGHLLPDTVVPLAQTAALQAAPYLNSQTTALFFQMVGTILVMTTKSGISRTEILLNAPSFANSKFFGATISIEKYATAPDSLNILLTGTNEAVKTFNQNISNLYAAFENGNFNFRIGRISAEYSIEKPLFQRKEPRRGKGNGSFSDERGEK